MDATLEAGPSSGRFAGPVHRFGLRVCFADTDAGGVMHHVAYLVFAERARTELLRLLGYGQAQLRREAGVLLAVRSCRVDYRLPALLDDAVELRSWLARIGGASLEARQEMWRGAQLLARLEIRLVSMTEDGRAARLPGGLRERLASYVMAEGE